MDLPASACYIDFFDRLNELWDLDIPFDSFEGDMSFENLVKEINRMITENNVLRLRIDWKVLQACFREWDDIELEKADLTGTVDRFLEALDDDFTEAAEDRSRVSDRLMTLIDTLYLDFSEEELKKLDALSTMSKVYQVLDRKLAARKRNDCLVRFGKNWSLGLRNLTREKLAEFGKELGGYPLGVPMKFNRGAKFGVIWHAGIEIEGETEPALPKPGHYVIRTEAGILEEYDSLGSLLDGGWAID